ncbi:high-affinity zinc uptake system membrane protein ZnuB [Clostridiales bacterium]|nr:high-affinity zinc uptake system membrane protein ZnuB [Clostridiales bacterium]
MNYIYTILEAIIPLSFIEYDFMKNSLVAVLLVTPLFGMLGTMAVNNKMAFFSDALGHSAMTGIAIGVILGIRDPLLCMIVFGILFGLCIRKVKGDAKASSDTVISVFSSVSMALGIVILSKSGSFSMYSSYLIGDILTVSSAYIKTLAVVLAAAYVIWYFIYNDLLLISINPSLASSRGVKNAFAENIFVIILSVAVMLSIKQIGILTINSLLILPAASARNVASNSKQYHIISTVISLFCGVLGLIISFYADTAAGASMVLLASSVYFVTYFISKNGRGIK